MPSEWRQTRGRYLRDRWVLLAAAIGGLDLVWHLPRFFGHAAALPGAGFLQFLFVLSLLWLVLRWLARALPRFMWAVRNRMLVTFFFLAIIPVFLTLALAGIAVYVFYGQYSVYLLSRDFKTSIEQVKDANSMVVAALSQLPHPRRYLNQDIRYYNQSVLPERPVQSFYYNANGQSDMPGALPLPDWLHGRFVGILVMPRGYYVAAFHPLHPESGQRTPGLLTLLPLDQAFMDKLTQDLGRVQLLPSRLKLRGAPASGAGTASAPDGRPAGIASHISVLPPFPSGIRHLPPATNLLDLRIYFPARLQVMDYRTGAQVPLWLSVVTRPSVLNHHLFSAMNLNTGAEANPALTVLASVSVIFLIFEALSLLFGLRLTRTITAAISDLYVGTEHINRGEFEYRIPVSTRDQLAALETSFNAMSASIRRLLREEQAKQRLESDLNIAQEVQAQLFPSHMPRVQGLELCGRCLPARVVSGDYFDFIPLDEPDGVEGQVKRVALALGDVSGKGISSALLMATVNSAIRAYQALPTQPRALPRAAAGGAGGNVNLAAGLALLPHAEADSSPRAVLYRLNRQLYLGTPPEKYITLFYAVYDADTQSLAYSNAGHPPPVVLSRDGRRRLETGGTVAGLFPEIYYEQETIALRPGDLLVAWSDGLTEPENEYGVEFGDERLMQLLERHRQRPLAEICDLLLRSLREWCGDQEQPDDATLMLARVG